MMHDKYESLDPSQQHRQIRYDRYDMVKRMQREAAGGEAAYNLGYLMSLTAMSLMYLRA
jgi:hypothetical protein